MKLKQGRGYISKQLVKTIWEKTNGICMHCNDKLVGSPENRNEWHIDHYVPLALNGEDRLENMVPACRQCNLKKGKLLVEEFLSKHNLPRRCSYHHPHTHQICPNVTKNVQTKFCPVHEKERQKRSFFSSMCCGWFSSSSKRMVVETMDQRMTKMAIHRCIPLVSSSDPEKLCREYLKKYQDTNVLQKMDYIVLTKEMDQKREFDIKNIQIVSTKDAVLKACYSKIAYYTIIDSLL